MLSFGRPIRIIAVPPYLVTSGLSTRGMPEVAIRETRSDWEREARDLLRYLADYVRRTRRRIAAGETFTYGCWPLKFVPRGDRLLDIHECNLSATEFVPGASLAMEFWRDQHTTCKQAGTDFEPPSPEQLIAVSPDLEGSREVEGRRNQTTPDKSGWIITTSGYSGLAESLRQEQLLDVIPLRRDLVRYLALPVGYRFRTDNESRVWFDDSVNAV